MSGTTDAPSAGRSGTAAARSLRTRLGHAGLPAPNAGDKPTRRLANPFSRTLSSPPAEPPSPENGATPSAVQPPGSAAADKLARPSRNTGAAPDAAHRQGRLGALAGELFGAAPSRSNAGRPRADYTAPAPLESTAYVSSVFINVLALALPLVILQVYDRILPNRATDTLAFLIAGLVGVIVVDAVMKIARSYLVGWSAARRDYEVRLEAVRRIINAPRAMMANTAPSAFLDRLNALDAIRDFHGGSARLLLLDLPFVVVFLGLIWFVGGALVLVPIVLFVLLGAATLHLGRALREVQERRADSDDRRYDFILEVLSGIPTVKSMAMEPQFQRRFERLQAASAATHYQNIILSSMSQTFGNLFANIAMVAVVSFGAVMVINEALSIGALACCTLLSGRTIQPLLRGIGLWTQHQTIAVARGQADELFELPAPLEHAPVPLAECAGQISVRDLSFSHDKTKPPVFDRTSLEIAAGSIIGFTGKDGGGKSTLLQLMAGHLEPDGGDIQVDGVKVHGPARQALEQHIAYVSQKSAVFEGTILENLTMFQTGAAIDYARIAAQLIGLEDYIHRLPEGYDTTLGRNVSDEVPTGIIQRIAIARALARRPRVLLFDEANSALDADGDRALRAGLDQLRGHMTILLVSNRPSLLKLSDQIYELKNNRFEPAAMSFDIAGEGPDHAVDGPAQEAVNR